MARRPRGDLTGKTVWVAQTGHNGCDVFRDREDQTFFLDAMLDFALAENVSVFGYALNPKGFNLLVRPKRQGSLASFMRRVGRVYVGRYNRRWGRQGTLWASRYRACEVASDDGVIAVLVSFDTEAHSIGLSEVEHDSTRPPLSAGLNLVQSSYRDWAGLGRPDPRLSPHPAYWGLGNTPFEREATYRERSAQGLPLAMRERLTRALVAGWPIDGDAPQGRPRGRPRKEPAVVTPERSERSRAQRDE